MEQVGWNIIHAFAESEMTLPNAEMALRTALAGLYCDEDWREALNMVNDTEPDDAEDLPQRIAELRKAKSSQSTSPASSSSVASKAATKAIAAEQLVLERNLDAQLQELKTRRRIFDVPTAQELLDDPEERLACETEFEFENDHEIVELVRQEIKEAEEPESESDDDEEYAAPMPTTQIIERSRSESQVKILWVRSWPPLHANSEANY
jgi:hypothetical protein